MNTYFVLFIAYIIAPKIDLVGGGGGGLTIRPEDIISVIAFLIYINKRKQFPIFIPSAMKIYFIFVGINYASALLNISSMGITGFVFATRLLQYALWFFVMYEACHTISRQTFHRAFTGICCIFIVWGSLEFLGLIDRVGQFAGASSRLTINTSGPFETSVMLAMLTYAVPSLLVTPPMLVLVLLTQARITLVGMVFSFGASRPFKAAFGAAVAFILFTVVAQPIMASFQDSRLVKSDSPARMVNVFVESWQRAPALDDPSYFRERFLDGPTIFRYMVDTKGDLSFRYRAVRWPIVIKTAVAAPWHFIVGWSPGAWGTALDNYYVRVFGETGLLGLLAFLVWLGVLLARLRTAGLAKFSIVMMMIVGCFIDIFTSSKVMPILWAFLALEHAGHSFAFPQRARQALRLPRPGNPSLEVDTGRIGVQSRHLVDRIDDEPGWL